MGQQLAFARTGDAETSWLAADRATRKLSLVKQRILAVLISGPKTDWEIEQAYRIQWPDDQVTSQSLRSRRSELRDEGKVRWTGEHGLSEAGGKARKWGLR